MITFIMTILVTIILLFYVLLHYYYLLIEASSSICRGSSVEVEGRPPFALHPGFLNWTDNVYKHPCTLCPAPRGQDKRVSSFDLGIRMVSVSFHCLRITPTNSSPFLCLQVGLRVRPCHATCKWLNQNYLIVWLIPTTALTLESLFSKRGLRGSLVHGLRQRSGEQETGWEVLISSHYLHRLNYNCFKIKGNLEASSTLEKSSSEDGA